MTGTKKFRGTKINPRHFSRSQLPFYIILVPLAVFMVIPVVYIINSAFKPMAELFAFPPTIFAKRFTLASFRMLASYSDMSGLPIARYIINSVIVVLVTVLLTIIVTVCSAYALSKKDFKSRDMLFKINQMALMFVPVAVSVPRFLMIVNAGLINSWFAHILPFLAMPIGLFLMKQFIDQLPDSLIESAKIDGAKDFTIITKIVVPLTRPAIATVAILTFQSVWGSVEASNFFITNESMKTISYVIYQLEAAGNPLFAGMIAAGGMLMFIPNLIMFIIMQSQVMNTMAHSGIK